MARIAGSSSATVAEHRPAGSVLELDTSPTLRLTTERLSPISVVVRAHGEIDLLTAPMLGARLRTELTAGPLAVLIIDLRGVTFMGVSVLYPLLRARDLSRPKAAALLIIAGTDEVMRPLQMTGLDRWLDVVTVTG